MPEVKLISAEAVALTTYEISYSISPGNKEKLDSAVIIFDDITVLSAPDITRRITLTMEENQTGAFRIKLDRLNHDYSIRIKLFSGENIWQSNSMVIRSSKSVFRMYLMGDVYAKYFNDVARVQNNTDTVVNFIIEFKGPYKPKTTEVIMSNKSLRHKIDFNETSSGSGLDLSVIGKAYLPLKLPKGEFSLTVVLDSISFPVEGRFMLLENNWEPFGTSFPGTNMNDYASFIVNDKLFLIDADPVWQPRYPAVWKFDLTTKVWQQKSNFPMPENEFWQVQHFNLQYKNRGFVLVLNYMSACLWEYNIENDSFSLVTTYPGQGRDIICFFIGDYLYAGCGRRNVNNNVFSYTDFWRYNMVSGSWEKLSDAPLAFCSYNYQICSGGGKGYVYDPGKKALWQFDTESGTWNTMSKLPGELRVWTKIAWLNNKVYLIGGETLSAYIYLNDCWVFTPETNSWTLSSFAPAYPTGFVCQYKEIILMGLGRQSSMDINEKNIYSFIE